MTNSIKKEIVSEIIANASDGSHNTQYGTNVLYATSFKREDGQGDYDVTVKFIIHSDDEFEIETTTCGCQPGYIPMTKSWTETDIMRAVQILFSQIDNA